jgi:16S rRNA (guanine(966)-N(2))-methyltransferase RsmD
VRITGGTWRSRRLRGPGKKLAVRPTPDAMRERAFAVLGDRVAGSDFLDLYAGTGAVGLEALSRGAERVVFVERDRRVAALLRANCSAFDLDRRRARIVVRAARSAVDDLARSGELFGLAWADPPFERWQKGLRNLAKAFAGEVLAVGATACLECPSRADVASALPSDLEIIRDLEGGASRVVMLQQASRRDG